MKPTRLPFEKCHETIVIPPEFINRRVEKFILPLDQSEEKKVNSKALDENGWPMGVFERTYGSVNDLPERES